MTSLQEHLKALFLFCLLNNCIAMPTSFCLFFVEEKSSPLLKQQLPELEDLTSPPIQKTWTLFCTDSRSFLLGVAEAGTSKLDLRALKSQNFFFLEYLLANYRATITIKTLLAIQTLQSILRDAIKGRIA